MQFTGERQVAPVLSGIRRDHVARYEFAARILPAGSRVVDIACGVGYGAYILANAGHSVVAIDNNAEAIEYARAHYAHERVEHVCADATQWAQNCGQMFDAAISFETIEHIEDPLPYLTALRNGAPRLLASVPNEDVFPWRGYKFHHRHYRKGEFAALLKFAGFDVSSWYGQAGNDSEVEDNLSGRTLIADAIRAEQVARPPQPSLPVPEHVAILGMGPSVNAFVDLCKRLGGRHAFCDEVWAINNIADVIACDRVFHMDDLKIQEARAEADPASNIAELVKWLKRHPGPVYTSRLRDGYPGLVEFPLEDVIRNGGVPYFNSTAAYAVAYARHIGVKRISPFGLDFTLPNVHNGERGRACVEFWLALCVANGIEVTPPEQTTLMDACAPEAERYYGYDCVEVHLRDTADGSCRVAFVDRDAVPTAQEIEKRYDHRRHTNLLMRSE